MKFNKLSGTLSFSQIKAAKKKWTPLILELGIRHNNQHCFTGTGGNNFMLFTLMGINHCLTSDPAVTKIQFDKHMRTLVWNCNWLINNTGLVHRTELDLVFPTIPEEYKVMAIAFGSNTENISYKSVFEQYKNQFPNLNNCLSGGTYEYIHKLSYIEQYILASILCQELAVELDKGITTNVTAVGNAILPMPLEIILLSVRRFIQIERLIKHNMDETPGFEEAINKVCRVIN